MATTMKCTKFDDLLKSIPKYPEVWNSEDVTIWLSLIGMDKYSRNFEAMSIDGLLILELTEEDLETELQINIKLHRKKIVKAIDVLKQYDNYLHQLSDNSNANDLKNINLEDEIIKEEMLTADNCFGGKSNRFEPAPLQIIEEEPKINLENNSNNERTISIRSVEGPMDMNFEVNPDGVKLGRHSSNNIVIFDDGVSRYHAEIVLRNNRFYIYDTGSTMGTFIKVIEPLELKQNMIIEIGSYQIEINQINITPNSVINSYIEATICEADDDLLGYTFQLYDNNSIGRKINNSVMFPEDLHMSNLHCKVYLIQNKFILEDIASTNGTWLRLSKEGFRSDFTWLTNGSIFKIGNSAMYEVIDNHKDKPEEISTKDEYKKTEPAENGNMNCIICWESERDCVMLPCRHNITCIKCVKSVKVCPFCRTPIEDIYRIFKC